MARYTGPDCKRCRREKTKLFLKGAKCDSPKCPIEIRPYPPGEHGRNRPKESEYLLQVREKQKAKRIYGILEKQFHNYYTEATKTRGKTGEALLQILESRLDNVIYRAGLRQEPGHGTPGGQARPRTGQRAQGEHPVVPGQRERHRRDRAEVPRAHAVHRGAGPRPASGRCRPGSRSSPPRCGSSSTRCPSRAQIDTLVQEQLIVEYYSK